MQLYIFFFFFHGCVLLLCSVVIPACRCISFQVCVLLYKASSLIDSHSILFMFVYCAAWLKTCLLLLLSNTMKGAFITICLQVKGENGDKWADCTMMNKVPEPENIYSVHGYQQSFILLLETNLKSLWRRQTGQVFKRLNRCHLHKSQWYFLNLKITYKHFMSLFPVNLTTLVFLSDITE